MPSAKSRYSDVGKEVERFIDDNHTDLSQNLLNALETLALTVDSIGEEQENKIANLQQQNNDLQAYINKLDAQLQQVLAERDEYQIQLAEVI